MTDLQPLASDQRIATLDVLRGFALLGILLMNIEGMAGPLFGSMSGFDPDLTGADRIADGLIYFFVQGKFFPLFSLLFGMGFAVMSARAEAVGRPFAGVYWRRGLVLLGFGLLHTLLVWPGDVLLSYAILSFFLLAFRPANARWLAWLGVLAALVTPAMMVGLGLLFWMMSLAPDGADEFNKALATQGRLVLDMLEAGRQAYGRGTFPEATVQRARDTGVMMANLPLLAPLLFGMFLLGGAFVKSGAIRAPQEFPRLYAWLRLGALPLGLALMGLSFAIEPTQAFDSFTLAQGLGMGLGMIAGVLMMLGYMGWVVRGLRVPALAPLLAWLAPAGRMALTNYLMQSLVCTWIFFGYGLGYFEQLPRAWQVPFCVALFAVQVLVSRWWLARFRFGPAEWLWRTLTYLKPQPMRREAPSPA